MADAIAVADTATCWDNSSRNGPAPVAEFVSGYLIGNATWPDWTPNALAERWPR